MKLSLFVACGATLAASAQSLTENESLFFTGESLGAAKAQLLRVPTDVPVITSSSRAARFEPGRDFVWQPGSREITLTADSRIPFKPTAELYPEPNAPHSYKARRNSESWMFYGPGRVMHDAQCAATYTSTDDWKSAETPTASEEQRGKLRERLKARQRLKIVMLGDSISTEADASALSKAEPNQPGYPTLVSQALEAKFGSRTTLVNLSKGGMDSAWGVNRVDDVIMEKPDLLLVAFGMNDASAKRKTEDFANFTRQIFEPVRAALPECTVILVSSMTANSEWSHASPELYPQYAAAQAALVGPNVAFADVTAVWTSIDSRKKHMDISGNGLNHPNDYGHRIYAGVILKTISQ